MAKLTKSTGLFLLAVVFFVVAQQTSAQFGDGARTPIDPAQLLNQLILKSNKNNYNHQNEDSNKGDNKKILSSQTPSTSRLFSSNLKTLPRLQKLRQAAKAANNAACHGRGCEGSDTGSRWSMPLIPLGSKQYYLGIFFKANWYKAAQYCRFHGMHLAAIESDRENRVLETHIQDAGLGHEHFWTSGTDQGEETRFFWMSNGKPLTFENWNAGEPNNFQYEDGEMEHCLELWNRDGKGLKWNDSPCSFETFFICEI